MWVDCDTVWNLASLSTINIKLKLNLVISTRYTNFLRFILTNIQYSVFIDWLHGKRCKYIKRQSSRVSIQQLPEQDLEV